MLLPLRRGCVSEEKKKELVGLCVCGKRYDRTETTGKGKGVAVFGRGGIEIACLI